MKFIQILEAELGKNAKIEFLPLQLGDIPSTFADIKKLEESFQFQPRTSLSEGIKLFVSWYRDFYKL